MVVHLQGRSAVGLRQHVVLMRRALVLWLVLLSMCGAGGDDGYPDWTMNHLRSRGVYGGHLEPGNCASYANLFAAYRLPVELFMTIAWRESGCDHNLYISDRNDEGGGLLGINLKPRLGLDDYWRDLCAITPATVTNAAHNVRCAAMAYRTEGVEPWVGGSL